MFQTHIWRQMAGALGAIGLLGGLHFAQAQTPAPKATAIFAGGCFWCIEKDFEKLPGVLEAESGYTAGKTTQPTYAQVGTGRTGHTEAVRLTYDPSVVSYAQLVEYFWRHIDPTVKDRQFCDAGSQYRSGIYVSNDEDHMAALQFISEVTSLGQFDNPIVTEVMPLEHYWPAEDYHQDYFQHNPHQGYCTFVVAPKVKKLQQHFVQWLKP